MSKVKILFFAADPLSAPPGRTPRLLLDDDVRQIRQKVRAAEYRDALDFDLRLAARPDDLLQALSETRPRVVHFSGHGGSEGLVLVGSDGRGARYVDAAALAQLFQVFRGDIQVVVLNACFSLRQAEAIAGAVGCAIGTRGEISDAAAITFGASFYRAIAFGQSVQAAFDQARAALALEHFAERDCPQLVARPDIDPTRLVLVSPTRTPPRARSRTKRAIVTLAVVGAAVAGAVYLPPERTQACAWDQEGMPHLTLGGPPTWVATSTSGDAASPGTDLEIAKARHRARNDTGAFPHFKAAAERGEVEAMGYLGVAYLCGEGTARRTDRGISWLRRAAGERDPRGMTALAFAYQHGVGVGRSRRWTRYWYGMAAETTGFPEAMRRLGGSYQDGEEWDSAVTWYRRAIDAGSFDAMVDLGSLYETGPRRLRDLEHARTLYDSAATAGSARGMLASGHIYQEGVGVPRDYARAMEWYRRAVAAGSVEAMNNVGVLYRHGWGVPRSSEMASYWFRMAENAGSAIARENLSRIDSSLPEAPSSAGSTAARVAPPPAAPVLVRDSAYRPPSLDDAGNAVQNGGFQSRFAEWTRSVDGVRGKGTNEVVSFADARSGYALHLAYEGRGSLLFAQKVSVSGPDYVFRGTFRASSHEGPMIGFSGTGIATVMLQYLDKDGRFLGMTSFYSYVANPLANTPLVGVPRRGNGGNNVHYIDVEKERLYKDYELSIRREIEENLLGVVADQVRTVAITLYSGATDDGAGAELWVSDLSLRPRR
ncbi:MAG TPA: CHAT domain-containing protein [Longimicrobium sp.]|nr:CHAT domain-containing protein [Longimicrobium sp.]